MNLTLSFKDNSNTEDNMYTAALASDDRTVNDQASQQFADGNIGNLNDSYKHCKVAVPVKPF